MNRSVLPAAALTRGLTALALITMLAGCSGEDIDNSETLHVEAVIKGLDNPFFQAMELGLDDAAVASGVDLTVQAAADTSDTVGQADKLTALGVQDYGCYVVNPISGTNLIQTLTLMASPDKPVVNIDSPLDPAAVELAELDIATYIGTDNKAAGGGFIAGFHGRGLAIATAVGLALLSGAARAIIRPAAPPAPGPVTVAAASLRGALFLVSHPCQS